MEGGGLKILKKKEPSEKERRPIVPFDEGGKVQKRGGLPPSKRNWFATVAKRGAC